MLCDTVLCIYLSKRTVLCVPAQIAMVCFNRHTYRIINELFCMCDGSKYLLKVTAVLLSEVLPSLIN